MLRSKVGVILYNKYEYLAVQPRGETSVVSQKVPWLKFVPMNQQIWELILFLSKQRLKGKRKRRRRIRRGAFDKIKRMWFGRRWAEEGFLAPSPTFLMVFGWNRIWRENDDKLFHQNNWYLRRRVQLDSNHSSLTLTWNLRQRKDPETWRPWVALWVSRTKVLVILQKT